MPRFMYYNHHRSKTEKNFKYKNITFTDFSFLYVSFNPLILFVVMHTVEEMYKLRILVYFSYNISM